MHTQDKLKGVYLPLTTPFTAIEAVDEAALRANVRHYASTGVAGYLVLGSNGENKFLSMEEQIRVAQVVYANKGVQQSAMVGALFESEKLVMDFVGAVGAENMDFLTLLTPSYFRKQMTDDALYGYFSRLADTAPVPVLLYNAPGFTGMTLSTALAERLCTHGNIVGIKDSGPGDIERFFHLNTDDFTVMPGSLGFFFRGLEGGGRGGIISLGNVFPGEVQAMYEAFAAGKIEEANEQQQRLSAVSKAVSGVFGVAGVKRAMDLVGLQGGLPRRPMPAMSDDAADEMMVVFRKAGLL
jgi:4-hydroxy-2-oxoglutarate aldolase